MRRRRPADEPALGRNSRPHRRAEKDARLAVRGCRSDESQALSDVDAALETVYNFRHHGVEDVPAPGPCVLRENGVAGLHGLPAGSAGGGQQIGSGRCRRSCPLRVNLLRLCELGHPHQGGARGLSLLFPVHPADD